MCRAVSLGPSSSFNHIMGVENWPTELIEISVYIIYREKSFTLSGEQTWGTSSLTKNLRFRLTKIESEVLFKEALFNFIETLLFNAPFIFTSRLIWSPIMNFLSEHKFGIHRTVLKSVQASDLDIFAIYKCEEWKILSKSFIIYMGVGEGKSTLARSLATI